MGRPSDGRTAEPSFAILGGGYFALAFLGYSHQNVDRLPTSQLLMYIHKQVSLSMAPLLPPPLPIPSPTVQHPADEDVMVARWSRILPGAVNHGPFTIVGHCLFALMAGMLGGAIAQWFRNRRERAELERQAPAF
jgi:hypothetical protein